jgi:uncharacterized protein YndB with AHSA1/START domain
LPDKRRKPQEVMQMTSTVIILEKQITGPAAAVYYALTNGPALREWLCTQSWVETRVDGRIYLSWQDGYWMTGVFTTLNPHSEIAYTWQGREEPLVTNVHITLTENGDGTLVALTHDGLDTASADLREGLLQGWETGLANLQAVLEIGLDRRVFDRPFLGIMISGPVGKDELAALGIDAEGGVRLSGTMDGTGAAAAGLQNEDIITDIGGAPAIDFASFREAMAPYRVDDNIKITFYRDGEKQQTLLTLGRRPAPDVPETPGAFADRLTAVYAELDAELHAILKDVTPAEAQFKPAPDEWNILEVLAHLVTVERGSQMGAATQITDGILDGFPNNPQAWLAGVTAVYPTLPEMLDLWKRTEAESVALIANLPDNVVKRKATYLGIGNTFFLGLPAHTRSHFDQIRANIRAAREEM